VSRDERDASRGSWNWRDVVTSTGVLLLIAATYIYFSG
jgi:hypothetical protein